MKSKSRSVCWIARWVVVAAMLQGGVVTGNPPVVAVFDVEGTALDPKQVSDLSEFLATRLAASGQYAVVPRSDIRKRLRQEKADTYKECYDESCQIEIGKELAAEQVVSTEILIAGETCILTLKIFDLRKAATVGAAAEQGACESAKLFQLIGSAVESVTKEAAPARKNVSRLTMFGLTAEEMTREHRREYSIAHAADGYVVTKVEKGSPANNADIRVGDVLLSGAIPLRKGRLKKLRLKKIANRQFRSGDVVYIRLNRSGMQQTVTVRPNASKFDLINKKPKKLNRAPMFIPRSRK